VCRQPAQAGAGPRRRSDDRRDDLGRVQEVLGLARLKSLARLSILYLDGSEITDDGLRSLSGATSFQILSPQ
jgi:hypothetical protein